MLASWPAAIITRGAIRPSAPVTVARDVEVLAHALGDDGVGAVDAGHAGRHDQWDLRVDAAQGVEEHGLGGGVVEGLTDDGGPGEEIGDVGGGDLGDDGVNRHEGIELLEVLLEGRDLGHADLA